MSRKKLNQTHMGVVSDAKGVIEFINLMEDGKSQIISWVSQETGKLNKLKFTQSEYVPANDRNNNSDMPHAEENERPFAPDRNQYVETRGTCYFGLRVHTSNDDAICSEN